MRTRILHDIWMAPTRAEGHKAFDAFAQMSEAKYLSAVELATSYPVFSKVNPHVGSRAEN